MNWVPFSSKTALLALVLGLGASAFGAESLKPLDLDRGRPGCWGLIRGGAMAPKEVDQLPTECKSFRNDYAAILKLVQKDKKSLQQQIIKALKNSKKAAPPYEAILFGLFLNDAQVNAAIQVRAGVEKKLKLAFRYADAASFRISGHSCSSEPEYHHPFYEDVCMGEDSILKGLYHLGDQKK